MIHYKKIITFLLITLSIISCKKETDKPAENTEVYYTSRIISLNSAVTEILCALGHQQKIVGVDVTAAYPEDIKSTATDLGPASKIGIESIMSLKPTLVVGSDKDISTDLEQKLKQANVAVKVFKQEFTVNGTKQLIKEVAEVTGNNDYEKLQNSIDADLSSIKTITPAPKVLFIYARGANLMMVSGTGTAEDNIINLAGGKNAITGFEDFKPLTPEALIQNNPDVILMYDSGLESLGGKEGILNVQGVDKTTAGKNKNIVTMDGGLVHAFGPRVGKAAVQLNALLLNNQPAESEK